MLRHSTVTLYSVIKLSVPPDMLRIIKGCVNSAPGVLTKMKNTAVYITQENVCPCLMKSNTDFVIRYRRKE